MGVLDAPVSGGDVGAKNGTLTIMVGGDAALYERVEPILKTMGSSIRRFGDAGQGQNAKMANQIMIAGTMTGMIESLVYAKKKLVWILNKRSKPSMAVQQLIGVWQIMAPESLMVI